MSIILFLSVSPVITDLTATNPMAASDRIEGTVIVADSGTPNVTVVVEVASDPCPEVQWSINGTNINDSANYFINNPCGANSSLYNFTITIANLTLDTSGQYSAVFSHLAGSTTLPGLYVTVPGKFKMQKAYCMSMTAERYVLFLLWGVV